MKNKHLVFGLLASILFVTGCNDDDVPPAENEEEVIDLVTLTFTPSGSGDDLVFTATDPDGEGPQDMAPDEDIVLSANTTYTLTIKLENVAASEDITLEVEEEGDEHMFFFSFTTDIFSDPMGDGNVDARADALNYADQDANNEPIGITTNWTTGVASLDGSFRVILKHQPDIKTETSGASDGETDVDITWNIDIN